MEEISPEFANEFNHGEPRKRFTETRTFRAFVFTAAPAIIAGAVATGGAVAWHDHTMGSHPGTYYTVAAYDHADPNHVDPGGGWVRVEAPDNGGTASTFHLVVPPSG
jgi:hypothetical protein